MSLCDESEISRFYRLKYHYIKQSITRAEIKNIPKYHTLLIKFLLNSKLFNIDFDEVPAQLSRQVEDTFTVKQ